MVGNSKSREDKSRRDGLKSSVMVKNDLPDTSKAPQDEAVEKDQTELELEKLVFGDDAGFKESLKPQEQGIGYGSVFTEDIEQDGASGLDEADNLEALADNDLFFLDSGIPGGPSKDVVLAQHLHEEHSDEIEPPAWIDSEDDRLVVSLASDSRLRKLRRNEGEDLVNGREYTKRLQEQFQRLYPTPEWAIESAGKHRKKQKRGAGSESSTDSENSDMFVDEDHLSTQPLAKLLQSTDPLTQSSQSPNSRRRLRPDVLDIQRTKDVGSVQPSSITSLSFHPIHPILLSSGPSSLLTLHHISPTSQPPNPTLHSLHVRGHPIHTSAFHPSGTTIFFASRRRYFHTWSLKTGLINRVTRIYGHTADQRSCERFVLSPCGRYMALVGTARKRGGVVNILDANTLQWLCQARVEGSNGVADLGWWRNGEGLSIISKSGEAIEYHIAQRAVVAKWMDEGAAGATVLALGGNIPGGKDNGLGGDRWMAVGSQSGIVNIYDRSSWSLDPDATASNSNSNLTQTGVPSSPNPKKVLRQLTTPTSHLAFADDGQMLAVASRWKADALRLVHLPSCTLYSRWPTSSTPLGRISALVFGPGGELLAVGNEAGKVRMWEIRG